MSADAVGWRRDDEGDGHSVGRLERTTAGWTAHGVEVLVGDGALACWFRIDLTPDWRTLRATARVLDAEGEREVLLEQADGAWSVDGTARDDLLGCVDVDVAATPLTNTFPIRRLSGLAAGESSTVAVAWVEVPSLRVLRVEQTYERLGERRWRYGDPQHGAFVLEVDGEGVVERYEGFAVRVR